MTRRRFLTMSAVALTLPRPSAAATTAEPAIWRGRALGADVSLRIVGLDRAASARLWRRVSHTLAQVEARFSLHRASELTRLNATGLLVNPSADMRALIALSDQLHRSTQGAFDPSVQPLWLALAQAGDLAGARARTGWPRVEIAADRIRLAPGMALTFNGIAQGHAADRIADLMRHEGLTDVLIDAGEIAALGGNAGTPWRVGIAGPDGAPLANRALRDRALATSSPGATRVGPQGAAHILHPDGRVPLWRTVSVSAPRAVLADGLSTAFCLMTRAEIDAALAQHPGAALEYLG
ncbi:MAG: FAD:protein FMN transferase [Rhodobacteraceae bacterium]|nr:FAD:protein FMN transferase [Paracoccaceae bacterium]